MRDSSGKPTAVRYRESEDLQRIARPASGGARLKKRFFTISGFFLIASLYYNLSKDNKLFNSLKSRKMFTVEQIRTAHSKVKSGADFPSYIKEIKALGVTHYEAYVTDGHIDYYGANDYLAKVPARYEPLTIANTSKGENLNQS